MTRKDTILIAVVINASLLAVLFTNAIIFETDKPVEQREFLTSLENGKQPQTDLPPNIVADASTGDEVDNVLKYYTQPAARSISFEGQPDYLPEPIAVQSNAEDHEDRILLPAAPDDQYVEVRVKKGDALDKIARANGTTAAEIKRINHLQSEKLSIGQVLKIPVRRTPVVQTPLIIKESAQVKTDEDPSQPIYYIVKSGDNPWKIAKQYGVNYEDILILNNLDEDKARNMKPGDRIRVK